MGDRRNQRIRGKRDSQLLAASCLVAGVYIAIVFLIGASRLGTWAARSIAAPVFGLAAPSKVAAEGESTGTETAPVAQSNADQPKTALLDLPEATCYTLQMGVYANRDNAEAQAKALKALGAGGYILTDGTRFRVLAAAYQDAESLNKVKDQLAADGVESAPCLISFPACSLSVTAEAEEIDAYRSALAGVLEAQQLLTEQALSFDREGKNAKEGVALCVSMRTALSEKRDAFRGALSAATNVSEAVLDFYGSIIVFLDDTAAMQDADTIAVSASLKYAAILSAKLALDVYQTVGSA